VARTDPRIYQISVLCLLLAYGVGWLGFGIGPGRVVLLLATCLLTQAACTRLWRLDRFDPRSALISGLSLSLLLRTNDPGLAILAASITIASKFVLRVDGRHVFNPTNFGLVAAMLATGQVWVSPGQWGHTAFFGFLMACLGGLVVNRAARSDVTAAFLGFHVAIVLGRALWLGDPLAVALHQLQSGALVLFAFFMISDPKTTPDTRAGRVIFALLVAAGAGYVQFGLFRTNGALWALCACAPMVPLINRCLPGSRYSWPRPATQMAERTLGATKEYTMTAHARSITLAFLVAAALGVGAPQASAFCGFYVSKADTTLFNRASQVVLVRDGDRTVLTMANDFRGDPKEFAVVIPVPTVLARDQIHVGDKTLIDHLDAYSAPRLVEYFDEDPCAIARRERFDAARQFPASAVAGNDRRNRALGVAVEAAYTVGEYDIVILSAQQSGGLETWLTENGYRIPSGASAVLGSYIRQNLRFFVARVNLETQSQLGFSYLRPLQIAYESPKFMLPIRLGTVNAQGSQDLFVFALTRKGRIETTNYRTVKLPTGMELPRYLKDGKEFGDFYQAMFSRSVEQEGRRGVFLEYAWDMAWCDPCAADPLSGDELRQLGVFWAEAGGDAGRGRGAPPDVFVTRLHVRYDAEHFPEDLIFQETADRTNFQGRYVVRHPWTGSVTCATAGEYRRTLGERFEREAQTLASLTGWTIQDVRRKMGTDDTYPLPDERPWWQRLWN
jgi:Na+-translocating ferredoxin:NAD+ oxidoreductase RnfD subunit